MGVGPTTCSIAEGRCPPPRHQACVTTLLTNLPCSGLHAGPGVLRREHIPEERRRVRQDATKGITHAWCRGSLAGWLLWGGLMSIWGGVYVCGQSDGFIRLRKEGWAPLLLACCPLHRWRPSQRSPACEWRGARSARDNAGLPAVAVLTN